MVGRPAPSLPPRAAGRTFGAQNPAIFDALTIARGRKHGPGLCWLAPLGQA